MSDQLAGFDQDSGSKGIQIGNETLIPIGLLDYKIAGVLPVSIHEFFELQPEMMFQRFSIFANEIYSISPGYKWTQNERVIIETFTLWSDMVKHITDLDEINKFMTVTELIYDGTKSLKRRRFEILDRKTISTLFQKLESAEEFADSVTKFKEELHDDYPLLIDNQSLFVNGVQLPASESIQIIEGHSWNYVELENKKKYLVVPNKHTGNRIHIEKIESIFQQEAFTRINSGKIIWNAIRSAQKVSYDNLGDLDIKFKQIAVGFTLAETHIDYERSNIQNLNNMYNFAVSNNMTDLSKYISLQIKIKAQGIADRIIKEQFDIRKISEIHSLTDLILSNSLSEDLSLPPDFENYSFMGHLSDVEKTLESKLKIIRFPLPHQITSDNLRILKDRIVELLIA